MQVRIGKYRFNVGKKRGASKLDCLTLQSLEEEHAHSFPEGRILIKKADYALLRVGRKEPIVKRFQYILGSRDRSADFIVLYVKNCFVGYKSSNGMKFIPPFRKKLYMKILADFPLKATIKAK